MMKETPPTLTLEATTFNKPQLQEQLSVLEQRQEAQIALAGRSNVGKSSLVNALARRKQLAKISATPGKTRSINFYRVAPDGFSLVDLPGYGYAKCSQEERKSWAKLIEYYLTNTPTLKALALLLDCRIPPQALDRDLADFARGHGIPLLPVLTKADKCTQVERSKRQQEWSRLLNGIMPLPVSSKDMRGVDALWSELRRFAGTGESVSEEELSGERLFPPSPKSIPPTPKTFVTVDGGPGGKAADGLMSVPCAFCSYEPMTCSVRFRTEHVIFYL